jgi:predicted O-methyltransferase YrrM
MKEILRLFEEHWSKVDPEHIRAIMTEDGGIDPLEGVLLYLTILDRKPIDVIEFSPQKGYSTMCIAMGLKQLFVKKMPVLYTFEINKKYKKELTDRLLRFNLLNTDIVWGDALEKVPEIIKSKNLKPDLCFIDSDHRAEFSRQYIRKIFPLLNNNCQVVVHDLCSTNLSPNQSRVEFTTSLLSDAGIVWDCSGEEGPLKEWLQENDVDYHVLHAITGGVHEGANLPYNTILYDELKKITSIDFRSERICPKTVWFEV